VHNMHSLEALAGALGRGEPAAERRLDFRKSIGWRTAIVTLCGSSSPSINRGVMRNREPFVIATTPA